MTDEELIRFAKEFRDGILDGRDPSRTCYMVSAPLAPLLRVSGVECSIDGWQTEEENHYFVRLKDNRILDPTIDQFAGWEETPVYLGTGIPKIHKVYLRAGGWFAETTEGSGPWRTKAAADEAFHGYFERAHELDAMSP